MIAESSDIVLLGRELDERVARVWSFELESLRLYQRDYDMVSQLPVDDGLDR